MTSSPTPNGNSAAAILSRHTSTPFASSVENLVGAGEYELVWASLRNRALNTERTRGSHTASASWRTVFWYRTHQRRDRRPNTDIRLLGADRAALDLRRPRRSRGLTACSFGSTTTHRVLHQGTRCERHDVYKRGTLLKFRLLRYLWHFRADDPTTNMVWIVVPPHLGVGSLSPSRLAHLYPSPANANGCACRKSRFGALPMRPVSESSSS